MVVIVDDVNDSSPRFERPVYNVTLDATAALGCLVVRVTAHDDDSGINAHVRYRFAAKTQVSTCAVLVSEGDEADARLY